ncbi:hypothetical protein [Enterorhabdus sp. P55]|uniref:hypothetical protein n=1 Tax=Enterorhabdus sp. P55 TaxID=2304571 RepID=UPI00136E80C8|nr:hypothetical protein [Enterorhabdus sp. P55]
MPKKFLVCCVVCCLGLIGALSLEGCQTSSPEAKDIYSADLSSGDQSSDEDPAVSLAKWVIRNQREEDPLWGVGVASSASPVDDFSIGDPLPWYQMDERGIQRLGFDSFPVFNNGVPIALLSFDKGGDGEGEKSAPRFTVDLPEGSDDLLGELPCLFLLVSEESGSREWLLSDNGEGVLLSGDEPLGGDPQELVSRLEKEVEYVSQGSLTHFAMDEPSCAPKL